MGVTKQDIQKRKDIWVEAFAKNDKDGLVSIFTKDCKLFTANHAEVCGHEGLLEGFKPFSAAADSVKIEVTDVNPMSDTCCYTEGHHASFKDGIQVAQGRVLDIWKKADGEWKCCRMMVTNN